MLASVAAFELHFHLTRPITWFYFVLFVAEGVLFMATGMEVVAGGGVGTVARNAPFAIAAALLTFTALNQVIVTGLVGTSVLRDYQYRTHELVFTTPITKRDYLGGRFLGAFAIMALVHVGLPVGLLLGTLVPRSGGPPLPPTAFLPYVTQYALLVLPTLFLTSAIFFAVGALTRSLFAIYTQGLVLLVVQLLTGTLLSNLDSQRLAALLDPFGGQAFSLLTRYWSVMEKGSRQIAADGFLLENRLVWMGVSLALLGATYAAFRFRAAPVVLGRAKAARDEEVTPAPAAVAHPGQRFDGAVWRAQVASSTRLAFWSVVRQPTFAAIVAMGIVLLLVSSRNVDVLYAQVSWPLTYTVVETLANSFLLLFILIVTLYTGEAVWRERQLKADQIADALPSGTSVALLGNLAGLVLVEALLLLILAVVGMCIQTAKGYTHFEPALYLRYLFGITFPALVQLTALAFAVHVVVNQKYVGHVVMVAFWGGGIVLAQLGAGHPMVRYAQVPVFRYSDLYRFGPFVGELTVSALYWSGVAGLLTVVAFLLWVRGTESRWRVRWEDARRRWTGSVATTAGASCALALAAGGTFFYNTNILHQYRSASGTRAALAAYERAYKPLECLALPRLVAADVRADLEPERRAFGVSGTFTFVNKHQRPLDSLLVMVAHRELQVDTLRWNRPVTTLTTDAASGMRVERLATPLAPGDTIRLRYRARYAPRGFTGDGSAPVITANGTYFRRDWFPVLGYAPSLELVDEEDRRTEGLPPRTRVASIDDVAARDNAYMLGDNADWIAFRATVSTAPDQVAVAPGMFVRDYQENGRRVFEYAMDAPMSNDYAILSARYAVRRESYRGVALEVLYHPGHAFNVDRMMTAMKASLDYYTTHFGPYQFRQLRIVEFPRYAQYALALPGTIPFSEAAGFIARPGDGPDDLDMPFYVTAHEVAHQWWGHQVAGADVQGYAWLSEGLSNYSALTVMEKRYGRERLQKFLAYELDQYLLGRGAERKGELPLMLVEGQPYIHYNKGSLALYAYRELIGEAAMNRALASFRAATAFSGPPYPTSRDLIRALAAETPDSLQYASTDLFQTITLWDNRTEAATARRRADGSYEVSITVGARKFRSDSLGTEREIPVGDLVDIGVFGDPTPGNRLGAPLHVQKAWLRRADTTYTVVVRARPVRAGIDPYNVLIDRNRRDNVKTVTVVSAPAPRAP